MTTTKKAGKAKPVKAWALKFDGKLDECMCFKKRQDALAYLEWETQYTGPVRVEIREVE